MHALVVFGTRPEAIKLAPVIRELASRSVLRVSSLHTKQHATMADSVLAWFDLSPDIEFAAVEARRGLTDHLTSIVSQCTDTIETLRPTVVVVQGDTVSAFGAALAAFHVGVPVVHVEAGLRSGDPRRPFPEEIYRQMISRLVTRHYCPTDQSKDNLLREAVDPQAIIVTGNTVVDALTWTQEKLSTQSRSNWSSNSRRLVTVTAHRRESWGQGLRDIFLAIERLAHAFQDFDFIIPLHLNPIVQDSVGTHLRAMNNVEVVPPLDYPEMVSLLSHSVLVITDSGGIQEESVALGITTLVTRLETDRPEGLESGLLHLVGTNSNAIYSAAVDRLTTTSDARSSSSVYGDGNASKRITDDLISTFRDVEHY